MCPCLNDKCVCWDEYACLHEVNVSFCLRVDKSMCSIRKLVWLCVCVCECVVRVCVCVFESGVCVRVCVNLPIVSVPVCACVRT